MAYEFHYPIEQIGNWTLRQFWAAVEYLRIRRNRNSREQLLIMRAAYHAKQKSFDSIVKALTDETDAEPVTGENAEEFGFAYSGVDNAE